MMVAAVLARTDDAGCQYAVFLDAVHGVLHCLIIPHMKWVVRKRMQLRVRNPHDLFAGFFRAAFFSGEQIIERGQIYAFGFVLCNYDCMSAFSKSVFTGIGNAVKYCGTGCVDSVRMP